jgi:hypothetical protein
MAPFTHAAVAQNVSAMHELAIAATSENADDARSAIAQLRAAGPAGLAALIDANADLVTQHRAGKIAAPADAGEWSRLSAAIDAVAAQKDAWASGLYWYTDLEAAKAAASASGKPILSLRLLGTLDSEFSCANSRFFRTVLYANAEVSQVLSKRFILHWKSVRPVPKVTIDFGDGRVVERTITGNSIHYILAPNGRVIDGIPGLYGPKAFLHLLDESARYMPYAENDGDAKSLADWHVSKSGQILSQWQADLRQVGAVSADALLLQPQKAPIQPVRPAVAKAVNPPAVVAARLATGKARVEMPLVAALAPDAKKLEAASTDETWTKVAGLHAEESRLDAASRALVAAKNPAALQAGRLAVSKAVVESPLLKIVQNFERSIAEDTVRNEYLFHLKIHNWLAQGKLSDGRLSSDVESLNERVYADLFLTPSSDPWLGLLPPNTYSALPDDGLCRSR